jgi:RNA polymerase sigma-70 factor (ECF subfamily)
MELTDAELADLYARYAHVLFHRCRRILRNDEDANDAVQETFARVIRNADAFRAQASPLTWMYAISTNHCLNQIRNSTGRQKKLDQHGDDLGPSGPADADREDHARILAMLDDADDETRACVVHTFFDDCTRQETADLVGLSVPTVRKRVNTFLERARRQLGAVAVAIITTTLPLLWSQP